MKSENVPEDSENGAKWFAILMLGMIMSIVVASIADGYFKTIKDCMPPAHVQNLKVE